MNDSVILHGKRDFADMLKLGIFGDKIILVYLSRPKVITRVLIRGRQEGQSQRDVKTEGEVRMVCSKEGVRGHETRNTADSRS